MNLAGIATTAGLINNALTTLKSARELAKDTSDMELREKIGDAYDALVDLREHALAQDEEIRQLKRQIEEKAKFLGPVAPQGYYYSVDDREKQHPICPRCFQSEPQRIAFMGRFDHELNRRVCQLCHSAIYN